VGGNKSKRFKAVSTVKNQIGFEPYEYERVLLINRYIASVSNCSYGMAGMAFEILSGGEIYSSNSFRN